MSSRTTSIDSPERTIDEDRVSPLLPNERALLRVARDPDHIDHKTNRLSEARIPLKHLKGEPVSSDPSRRQSMSTFKLCSQPLDIVRAIATELTKEDHYRDSPIGAAALCEHLLAIEYDSTKALEISQEPDPDGRPGHVAIRFAETIRLAGDPIGRIVRNKLIEAFGVVQPVTELHRDRCA